MPITFACPCGKTLRVNDDLAGRRVRCPACQAAATVPAAEPPPAFEVVDDPSAPLVPPPPPPPARPRVKAAPAAELEFEVVEDAPRPKRRRYEDDGDEDDRPRRRRRDEDDEDDRPRRRKPKKKAKPETGGHFGVERKVLNAGVLGGVLAMVGAVVWFVLGLMADRIFFYPPVLFVLGAIGAVKGLVGGDEE